MMSREDDTGSKEVNGSSDKCNSCLAVANSNGGLNGKSTINVGGGHVAGDVSPLTRFLPKAKKVNIIILPTKLENQTSLMNK